MTLGDARPSSEERFEAMFRHEYPQIVRVAYLMIGDRSAAEDVAQEAFTRLYARWWRVSRYDRPGAWVRRVAIRLAARSRAVRIRESAPMLDAPMEPGQLQISSELHRALLQLPAQQRAALVLHYVEDLPVREVAEVLRCSTATAKVHLHRARKRLEEKFTEARHVG